jgi:iron-regulated transporter 1
MQEYVPEDSRGVINSVEYSLTNVFSLLSYGMGIVFYAPEQFGILVLISFGVVTVAAMCYSLWLRNGATLVLPSPRKTSAEQV